MTSIPEKATQLVENLLSQVDDDNSRTLFLVGSKGAGKSTLLNLILDKTDAPRDTLVLEYSFARKSNQKQALDKTVCHIWEYGGKLEMLKNVLTSVPRIGKYFFCVMVDLSKLKSIWNTTEVCFQAMHEMYTETQFLPETVIVCGKYDIFKNYDNEIKKVICTSIRSLALLHNAHLLFYSSKDQYLFKRAKDMLNSIGFGNCVPIKEKNTNYTKPLFIPKGTDTWESIGVGISTLEEVKVRHLSRIPSEVTNSEFSSTTPSQQHSHPEPGVDSLASFKYDEIRSIESFDNMSFDDYLQNINK